MGCDIHFFVEAKKKRKFSIIKFWKRKKWVTLDWWTYNKDSNDYYVKHSFYKKRNYNLFSALCGVRSYCFLGSPSRISDPRGIPKDCCKEIKRVVKEWGEDGHSHNYNTLKELKEFDWSAYGDTCDDLLKETIPLIERVTKGLDDTDVRIVYFFDN